MKISPRLKWTGRLALISPLLFPGLLIAAAQAQVVVPEDSKPLTHYARTGNTLTTADAMEAYQDGDMRTAFMDFTRLAPQGDPEAQFYLAYMLDNGYGTGKNPFAAVSWYKEAAQQDYLPAVTYMGYVYSAGHGVTRDDKEAFKWYTRAAQLGSADAQNALGIMLRDGRGYKKDNQLAAQWFLQSATQGNAHGQSNLAMMYHFGLGVKANDAEALRWYTYAAAQKDPHALTAMGGMYRRGEGVAKDSSKALEYYGLAAKQGYAPAEVALADMYESSEGDSTKGPTDAAIWYARAAKQGNPVAQTRLGYYFENGYGLPQDVPTAITWYTKAFFDNNYAPAVLALGHLYETGGKGLLPNLQKAFNMYQKCANAGEPHCQKELGRLYKEGKGTMKDLTLAYQWLALAAQGFPQNSEDERNAVIARIQLSNALTEQQLNNARRMVDVWKPIPLAQQSRY